ncbi:hypothetical protein DYY67_0612 [Candidatus Nitrosotalea sp. TS]|uniref:hypothetical protein n=1 Tax=Candidatus Nitrosotalea sp. TS TaxID=2341020 RepID=UPI00140D14FB|nr:hypothetical protein [Candidatus Nitrosotalea sp. TS]NHI02573.1 hypothetical protein [Candidatus Nitrosotalea sp. TS]
MDHSYYFDGNTKSISWVIENNETYAEQIRTHAENYYDLVSTEQSKYIALHVGLFWGIGRFVIKNSDTVNVMLDLKSMFDHLAENKIVNDPFIISKTRFIHQLIDQRGLQIRYNLIEQHQNRATSLLLQ